MSTAAKSDAATETNPDTWSSTHTADLLSKLVTRFTTLHATDLTSLLKKDIRKAKVILDVGCGAGAFGLAYVREFPQGIPGQTLILSDISQEMLNRTQRQMEAVLPKEFITAVEYKLLDGTTLEYIADDSIDVVVSTFGIFLIPDRASALQAVQRVLKPGKGVFGTSVWTSVSDDVLENQDFGIGFQDSAMKAFGGLDHVVETVKPVWLDWFEPAKIPGLLGYSFDSVKVSRAIHSVVWDEFEDIWQCISTNPLAIRATDMREKLKEKFLHGDEDSPIITWTASNLVVARTKRIEYEA